MAAAAAATAAAVAALPAATLAAVLPVFQVEIAGSILCAVSSTGCTDSSRGRRSSRC